MVIKRLIRETKFPKTMGAISTTDFDPFNHGTTAIRLVDSSPEENQRLSGVLKHGWGLKSEGNVEEIYEGPKKSNNYKVKTPHGNFLLKQSHITDVDKQKLVNRSLSYCCAKGILVPSPIPGSNKETYHTTEGKIFCLYPFLGGSELFDGTREELVRTAQEFGRLHRVLASIPYGPQLIKANGQQIIHDRQKLGRIAQKIRLIGGETEFDKQASLILEEILDASERISSRGIESLPAQIVHADFHPHNILFNADTKKLISLLDFDNLSLSQRARDMGFGMHRFSRTYGERTERKNDCGADIRERAKLFLKEYASVNPLTDKEIIAIAPVLEDEALGRILTVLGLHYLEGNTEWDFDLEKQVTTLREASLFKF